MAWQRITSSVKSWLKERRKKGITDPLGQNIVLYVTTYFISAVMSVITTVFSQERIPASFDYVAFFQTLAACVLPTAITTGLGTFIQNYDVVSKNKIEHSGRNLLLLILTLVYPLGYVALRLYGAACLNKYIFIGAAVISGLGLWSISQIDQALNRQKSERNLSADSPSAPAPASGNAAEQPQKNSEALSYK